MVTKSYGPVSADVGPLVSLGHAMTARTLLETATSGGFSVVEHLLSPRELAAPLNKHSREEEYTVVIAGRLGFLLGDEVFHAGPGDLVRKPRDQWHTFGMQKATPRKCLRSFHRPVSSSISGRSSPSFGAGPHRTSKPWRG